MKSDRNDFYLGAFSLSVFGHLTLAFFIFVKIFPGFGDLPAPVVYSVSIEPNRVLGGMIQVPKDDKKTEMAPIKNVTAQTKPEEQVVKPPEVEPVKQPKVIEQPVDDAEVSTAETKPTPMPPKPTPEQAKPTAAPVKPTSAPTAKPTVAPSKPTTSPTAKPDKEIVKQKSQGETVDKRLDAALQRYLGPSSDAGGKQFGGDKNGIGKGAGGSVVRPPEFFEYLKMIQSRTKEAWRWYDTNSSLNTQVHFFMERDGRVRDVTIAKGSGDNSFDESVVRAVLKASPLPPPPDSVYEYFKEVRILFDPRQLR